MPIAPAERAYLPEIDGLRAVAVLLTIAFHAKPLGPVSGGFVGVDIFFVLSAFLITGILADRQSIGTFYWRRFLRLTPALLLMLATYLVAAPFIWPDHDHGFDALLAALYLSDFSYTFWRLPFYLRHTWSLAIEEHFYLIWPFVLAVLLKTRRPDIWLAVAFVALTYWRLPFADYWKSYYSRLDTHSTGLILGAWLWFALPRLKLNATYAWLALGTLALVATIATVHQAWLAITIAEIAAAVLVGCLASGKAGAVGAILRTRPMVTLGKLSYGMYLWHFPISYALRDLDFITILTLTFGLSLIAAAISYSTVEAAARRLKRKSDKTDASVSVELEPMLVSAKSR